MSCVASLGRFQYASGAEEKVIRVFEAPQNFLENYARICRLDPNLPERKRAKRDLNSLASVFFTFTFDRSSSEWSPRGCCSSAWSV